MDNIDRNTHISPETPPVSNAPAKKPLLGGNGRRVALALIDALWMVVCFVLVWFFHQRTEYIPQSLPLLQYWPCLLVLLGCTLLGRLLCRAYANVWRYPNVKAYMTMLLSDTVSGAVAYGINRHLHEYVAGIHIGFWQTFTAMALFALGSLCMRFSYQLFHARLNENGGRIFRPTAERENKINIAIVGAGQTGMLLAEQLNCNERSHYRPYCFIDIDKVKIGSRLCGLKVYDENDDILTRLRDMPVQEIFIALPKLPTEQLTELCKRYSSTDCKVKVCSEPREPGQIRFLSEEDYVALLGREALKVNDEKTLAFYRDKTVLVTGGGGSIGSEICRQIARCHPKQLIVLDIQEEGVYKLCLDLRHKYPELPVVDVIASVRDIPRLNATFRKYRPDVVFHAAAHKHVPLMECNSCEAVKNNIIGTYNTANAAEACGVSRFVLISTDKAVNPTNIMGASKRMCERVIQCRRDSATVFTAVRFGNVLGSSGSVIPLFQKQIAAGGPVTVTDHRITRYFMTIPEASQLVMQAGAMAQSGELFVLHMGAPVRIQSLAENLIYMSGYIPNRTMQIIETGLRPGEKLYEELLVNRKTCRKTANDLIYVETEEPPTRETVEAELNVLREAVNAAAEDVDSPLIRAALKQVVPTFREPDEVNKDAERADEIKSAVDLNIQGSAV